MITIDGYTGRWDAARALRHKRVRVGELVRIHVSADGREYDAFERTLADLDLEASVFVRWMPRAKLNVYRITRRK